MPAPLGFLRRFMRGMEGFAGQSTTAAETENGYWLRIARAAESLADNGVPGGGANLGNYYTKAEIDNLLAGIGGGGPAITAPTITSANPSGSYAENAPISGTVTANKTATFSVTGPDAGLVTLNGTTGNWLIASTDYETKPAIDFTFVATGETGLTGTQAVAITITDVAEGGGIPAADSDFGAPEASRTSGATAYPVTVDPVFLPAEHMVGDTLRVLVTSAVTETGGLLLPSGSIVVNDTITLASDPATNRTNLNAKLAGIAAGMGFVFLRSERGAQASSWSIPVQYGTAAVPAITSPLTSSVVEGVQLAYSLTLAAPAKTVYIVGQDGDRVEFTGAKPGSTFALRFTGGATKTFPADDFNTDNVYDIGFEVIGLNDVSSGVQAFALTLLDLDLEADAFDFANVADVPLGAYGESPTTITVSGLTPGYTVPVSVGAGTQIKIGDGAWGTTGDVQNGSLLKARVQTPGTAANTTGTVSYGGKTDNFVATNVGYTAPVLSTWAGATGSGISDGSITLSNDNRTATMTRAEGPREIISSQSRNSGKRWVEFSTNYLNGSFNGWPGLFDAAAAKTVRYESNTAAGDAGGGWNIGWGDDYTSTIRFEVDFTTGQIQAFIEGVSAGTKAFPAGATQFAPMATIGGGTGPTCTINTGQSNPMGGATAGFEPWS